MKLSEVKRRVLKALLAEDAYIAVYPRPDSPYLSGLGPVHYTTFRSLLRQHLIKTPDDWGWNTRRRYFITPAGREALGEQDAVPK